MRISRFSIYEIILFHLYLLVYVLTFSRKDEWGPTILLLVLTVLLIILELLRVGFLPSPLLIWYVFWIGVISVGGMDLNLYPFYQTWSPELLKVIVLNTLVFFWLFWVGELVAGTAETEIADTYYNMREHIEPHMVIVDRAKAAFLKNGVQPLVQPIRGGTDGAQLTYRGLPCPNLSTGGENFHGRFEYVPVEDMESMVAVIKTLVTDLAE